MFGKNPFSVLIATSRFRDFAGSEVTALELALEFHRCGCNVAIGSFEIGGELERIVRAKGLSIIDLSTPPSPKLQWDLTWIIHPTTFYRLFGDWQITANTVIYSSLSHFEPLESPPIEIHPIDLFTVNSVENRDFFSAQYPELVDRVMLLPNSVPLDNFQLPVKDEVAVLSRIAIVSNHPPEEVIEAARLLRSNGLSVDLFGNDGEKVWVTGSLLCNYDAVISIGKTVQYCLAQQIPVFCYDHFGGPGWIQDQNVRTAADFNFSGRCTPLRLTPESISAQFDVSRIPEARARSSLRRFARKHFFLPANVRRTLSTARRWSRQKPSILSSAREQAGFTSVSTQRIAARHAQIIIRARALELELRQAWTESIHQQRDVTQQLEDERKNSTAQIQYRDQLIAELTKQRDEIDQNANAQIAYRDALVHELEQRLAAVERNASSQITYRDQLISQLKNQLSDVERNANAQIAYRDALLSDIRNHLEEVERTSSEEITNRDQLISELNQRLSDVDQNANEQIAYRDALVQELEQRLTEVERNASDQITYRDQLVGELRKQLNDIDQNANAQIAYRDALTRDLEQRLAEVERNASEQIAYRDQLVSNLSDLLGELKLRSDEELSRSSIRLGILKAELENERQEATNRTEQLLLRISEMNSRCNTAEENLGEAIRRYETERSEMRSHADQLTSDLMESRRVLGSRFAMLKRILFKR